MRRPRVCRRPSCGRTPRVRLQVDRRGEIVGCMRSGRRLRRLTGPAVRLGISALLVPLSASGCSYVTFTTGERSAVEQELVVRSIDRAITALDSRALEGRRASFDLYGLTKDQVFAKSLVSAHLRARGIRIVDSWESPDLRIEVFAAVLGIDQTESLIGIPALQVPVVSVPIPEIAL